MRYAGALAVAFFSAAIGLAHLAQPAIAAASPTFAVDGGFSSSVEWWRQVGPTASQPTK